MNANVSTTLGPASSVLPAVVCLSLFGEVRDGVTTKYYTQQFVVLVCVLQCYAWFPASIPPSDRQAARVTLACRF